MEKRATKGFYCREREASPEVKDSVLMGGAEIYIYIYMYIYIYWPFSVESTLAEKVRALSTKNHKGESAFSQKNRERVCCLFL